MYRKLTIVCLATAGLWSGYVAAEPQDILISASVAFADADYQINGVNYDGDLDLGVVSSRFYLTDQVYASVTSSSGDGTIANVSFDTATLSLGAGVVLLDRVDYVKGTGSELRVGFDYSDTEVTAGNITADDTSTDLLVGYTAGLGNGLSAFAGYSANLDEFGDNYGLSAGLYKSLGGNWLIGGSYQVAESDLGGGDTSEVSGIQVGIGYAF